MSRSSHFGDEEGVCSTVQVQNLKVIAFPRSAVKVGCKEVGCEQSGVVVVVHRVVLGLV